LAHVIVTPVVLLSSLFSEVDVPNFKSVVHSIGTRHKTGSPSEEDIIQLAISGVSAVLLFGDFDDAEQLERVLDFTCCLGHIDAEVPPVVLVHHCSRSKPQAHDENATLAMLSNVVDVSIDGGVLRHSEGIQLACDIRCEIRRQVGR